MALLKYGVKPEDARYVLPEATKTNLIMTCNVRQLFHIFDMRMDKAAQWEIRRLASALQKESARGLSASAGLSATVCLNWFRLMAARCAGCAVLRSILVSFTCTLIRKMGAIADARSA